MIVHKCDICKTNEVKTPTHITDWSADRGPTHEYPSDKIDICGGCALVILRRLAEDRRATLWGTVERMRGGRL